MADDDAPITTVASTDPESERRVLRCVCARCHDGPHLFAAQDMPGARGGLAVPRCMVSSRLVVDQEDEALEHARLVVSWEATIGKALSPGHLLLAHAYLQLASTGFAHDRGIAAKDGRSIRELLEDAQRQARIDRERRTGRPDLQLTIVRLKALVAKFALGDDFDTKEVDWALALDTEALSQADLLAVLRAEVAWLDDRRNWGCVGDEEWGMAKMATEIHARLAAILDGLENDHG